MKCLQVTNERFNSIMNIVIIHTHDTGRYISPYGYPAKTKALQIVPSLYKMVCTPPLRKPPIGSLPRGVLRAPARYAAI